MNRNEIVDLITLAAVYDQRTSSESDVRGWLAVAELESWTAPAAQRVVIEHYSRQADRPRITPAAISDGIRAARRKAATLFITPDCPDHITGRAYPPWYRTQLAAHIDRILEAWVNGEPIPEASAEPNRRELTAAGLNFRTCPPELREQIMSDLARAGRIKETESS